MYIFRIVSLLAVSVGLSQSVDIFKAIEFKNSKQIQQWLKSASNLDVVNNQGQTVLMKAVLVKNSSLVRQLLQTEIKINAVDQFGRTALDYAVELGNKKIAKMLIKAQAGVTTESNAVRCRRLVSSNNGFGRFVGAVLITLGIPMILLGMICCLPVVVGATGGILFGCVVGLVGGTGLLYGGIRANQSLDHAYRIGVVRSIA